MTDITLIGENKPITISRDQDWNQPFWLVDGTRAFDLTSCTLELYIRPTFDHATQIRKLTSAGGSPEIIVDDAPKGAAHILVTAANVTSALPVSPSQGWAQFLRVVKASGTIIEWWRGPLIVRAGKVTP